MTKGSLRIALLISGGGTTATAIIAACRSGRLTGIEPVCVIASKPDAGGIEKVQTVGFPKAGVHVVVPRSFARREAFGEALLDIFEQANVDFVGQYGWNPKTPVNVIERYRNMMTNQHPGPLDPPRPDFGGAGMYGRRVVAARLLFVRRTNREFWTEATAQRVGVNLDVGAVLGRKQVPVLPEDDVGSLQARLLPEEHELQIETLQHFANGTVTELARKEPLVRPEEVSILEECRAEAIRLYPEG